MKFNQALAAVAAVAALASAPLASQAAVIVIDDFAVPGAVTSITDDTVGGVVTSGVWTPLTPPSIATSRVIDLDLTSKATVTDSATVKYGGGAAGFLLIDNTGGGNSKVTLTWTTSAISPALTDPSSFAFDVFYSVLGQSMAVTDISFSFTGVGGSFGFTDTIGGIASPGGVKTFSLGAGNAGIFSQGGTLKMVISNASPGWELALDAVQLRIPEPGSIALAGLALLGLGLARRRQA